MKPRIVAFPLPCTGLFRKYHTHHRKRRVLAYTSGLTIFSITAFIGSQSGLVYRNMCLFGRVQCHRNSFHIATTLVHLTTAWKPDSSHVLQIWQVASSMSVSFPITLSRQALLRQFSCENTNLWRDIRYPDCLIQRPTSISPATSAFLCHFSLL
jgi:hypothetical protein